MVGSYQCLPIKDITIQVGKVTCLFVNLVDRSDVFCEFCWQHFYNQTFFLLGILYIPIVDDHATFQISMGMWLWVYSIYPVICFWFWRCTSYTLYCSGSKSQWICLSVDNICISHAFTMEMIFALTPTASLPICTTQFLSEASSCSTKLAFSKISCNAPRKS